LSGYLNKLITLAPILSPTRPYLRRRYGEKFPAVHIQPATPQDILQLLPLVNSAFRGESSKKGWTHEANLIAGTARTDAETLRENLLAPDSTMLKYCDDADNIKGCVHLQKKERGLYLGMLTVSPELQGGGVGKQLLAAAEEVARQYHCPGIYMTVLSVRHELVAWYERHGYHQTGERQAFEVDAKFGNPVQPLELVILEKTVPPA